MSGPPASPPLQTTLAPAPPAPKLLERVRTALRQRAVQGQNPVPPAADQEQACLDWLARFIRFHGLRHPKELGPDHVAQFLLTLRDRPTEHAVATAALRFLYVEFLLTDPVPPPPPPAVRPAAPAPTCSPFLNRCHEVLRLRHYSLRTEECYVNWIRRFILFHGKRHPTDMGAAEIEAFLTHLAVHGRVSASTQNQAFHALLFLYQQVLEIELPRIDAVRARRPERLPVVMSRTEVRQVLDRVVGAGGLFPLQARLQYGTGLRVLESCQVRYHDLDLDRGQLLVRAGKGNKDRVVMIPHKLRPDLAKVLTWRRRLHERDRADGFGWVFLPGSGSIPAQPTSWAGSTCLRRGNAPRTHAPDRPDGTTSTSAPCSGPSPRPSAPPGSPSTSPATPSATASRPTCSKWATTSAPCRRCWGTRTSPRR
jgi:site-specific recombinase XerD